MTTLPQGLHKNKYNLFWKYLWWNWRSAENSFRGQ